MPKNRTSACGRMLEHVLPPNVPADTMQGIIVGSLAIGALTAAIDFTVHYAATYRGMFYWDGRLMDGSGLLAAIIVLAIMILPSIIKVSVTALEAVPSEYEDASLALGATPVETYFRVSVPAARSGIAAAVVLGLCYLAWRFITPEQCIPTAENIQRVMNAIAASPYAHYYG